MYRGGSTIGDAGDASRGGSRNSWWGGMDGPKYIKYYFKSTMVAYYGSHAQ